MPYIIICREAAQVYTGCFVIEEEAGTRLSGVVNTAVTQGSDWNAGSRHVLVHSHAHAGGMLLAGLMGKLQVGCMCIHNKAA